MTYPPQPGRPYGQQPDPYGQGGRPPSGDFPQQYPPQQYPPQQYPPQYPGQQYPQQGGYAQQPYPGYEQQQPYGQGFGGPPPPPPKSKTGLLIAIAAAVVVLVAVGVTGFIAPGFFLNKDAAGPDGAQKVAQAIVDGINAHDKNALTARTCADADPRVNGAIASISEAPNVTLGQVQKVSDSEYKATVTSTSESGLRRFLGLAGAGGTWCWKTFDSGGQRPSTPTSTGSSRPTSQSPTSFPPATSGPSLPPTAASGEGVTLLNNFVDKINAKDKAGATALICAGQEHFSSKYIDRAVDGSAQITIGHITQYETGIGATVGGTLNGKRADGTLTANTTGTFCVSGFLVY